MNRDCTNHDCTIVIGCIFTIHRCDDTNNQLQCRISLRLIKRPSTAFEIKFNVAFPTPSLFRCNVPARHVRPFPLPLSALTPPPAKAPTTPAATMLSPASSRNTTATTSTAPSPGCIPPTAAPAQTAPAYAHPPSSCPAHISHSLQYVGPDLKETTTLESRSWCPQCDYWYNGPGSKQRRS